MSDPLTALMYAVQVMNFLKSLILRTLKGREDFVLDSEPPSRLEPSDENGHHSPPQLYLPDTVSDNEESEKTFVTENPDFDSSGDMSVSADINGESKRTYPSELIMENPISLDERAVSDLSDRYKVSTNETACWNSMDTTKIIFKPLKLPSLPRNRVHNRDTVLPHVEKYKEVNNLSLIDYRSDRIEAWR